MKVETSALIGPALDWAVEAAKEAQFKEGRIVKICRREETTPAWVEVENAPGSAPLFHCSSPSTNWSQGGPIIEREKIGLFFDRACGLRWRAHNSTTPSLLAETPLIAAMRCYVASKLGDEVDVPEELLE